MIIDSHQHVCWHDRDIDGLVADMDEHGIDFAWLLTWEVPPAENPATYHRKITPLSFREDGTHAGMTLRNVVTACRQYPDRFVAGYCPHPGVGSAAALFEAAYHMHNVRVCGEWKFRIPFDDPRAIELFRTAGRLGCPVVLHLDVPRLPPGDADAAYIPTWYGGGVDRLERALQRCPDTIFVGHAAGFWREISGDAATDADMVPRGPVLEGGRLYRLFDTYPNLYADLSAGSARRTLSRDIDHAKAFIVRFADRLLFGRDYYGADPFPLLRGLDLPGDVSDKIYWQNAQRLVPIVDRADAPGSLVRK